MNMREISWSETELLYPCIAELAAYHNKVSANFKGIYPVHSYHDTLEQFRQQIMAGSSRVAIIEDESVFGFCKVDVNGSSGKLDYLIVAEQQRGQGYGRALMDWAMDTFKKSGVSCIEVKVVDGSPAIHLYEKYGFRLNAHILRRGL